MRQLYIFPIIHTDVELGSLAPELKKQMIRKKGLAEWKRHEATIEHFWDNIERKLRIMNLDNDEVHIYQDGFHTGMDSVQMVEDLAARGSRNYLLIQSLVNQGAKLVGTENPDLVLKEYELTKGGDRESKINASELLRQRDVFIAQRIVETLPEDKTGILFIGAKHNVASFLPGDIKTTTIIS